MLLKYTLILILPFLIWSCKTAKMPMASLPPDWQLSPIPNSGDDVGTIFAIGKKKISFVCKINVKKESFSAAVPYYKSMRNVSYSVAGNFLGLKDADTAALNISGGTISNATVSIANALDVRHNDNLKLAFDGQKQLIMDNLEALNLMDAEVYIITEAIKSNKANLTFSKEDTHKSEFRVFLSKIIRFNPNISVSASDSSSLDYASAEPLCMMYKVNKLSPIWMKKKDPGGEKYIVSNVLFTDQVETTPLINKF